MDEFGHGGLICPIKGVGSTEYSEVGFEFLIYSFSFSVSLRVVCRGWGEFVSEYPTKFFLESGHKLRSSVRDDIVKESKSSVKFSEDDGSNSFSGGGFLCRA